MSISCPFCKKHYSSTEIYKEEKEIDIKNMTSMICKKCDGVFIIKTYIYYEPSVSSWRTTIKIRENKNYDNN